MRDNRLLLVALLLGPLASFPQAQPAETLDYATLARIREEGLLRSQVMDHAAWLTDNFGPRITGTPQMRQAGDWAVARLKSWGLANVHEEPFPFGKGWSLVRFHAHMTEPQPQPIIGYPKGWSPSTTGTVTADVVQAVLRSDADFAKYHGTLKGKVVLTQPAREVRMLEGRVVWRMSDEDLAEAARLPVPPEEILRSKPPVRPTFDDKLQEFLLAEGVVATLDRGGDSAMAMQHRAPDIEVQRPDGGTIFVGRMARPEDDHSRLVPSAVIAVEHYNRMVRLLEKKTPVKMELHIETAYHDNGPMDGFNIIAELPGTDLAGEVVMIGAHFDAQYAGTGATDNAAGSAAMMEAMRILKTIGVKPRRTIRLALWGGEELGHLGSRHYAREHFGDVTTMQAKPEHEKLAAYFNIDNGTGKVRGVWLQGNLGVNPIFRQWIGPLADLGVTTLAARSVGGTDHQAFDELGLPGFQFIQDRLEYTSRTHHSNMDVYDRLQKEDLMQIATVVATFAYNAAMRNERLPREALPAPQPWVVPLTAR
jgi:hypothetical protein